MKLADVRQVLAAELLCGEEFLEAQVATVCGADLMSDVLSFTKHKTLLLTGLTHIQVIRTADISDLVGVVFVRGKRPMDDVTHFAQEKKIPILVTDYTMYEACGILYRCGLASCHEGEKI